MSLREIIRTLVGSVHGMDVLGNPVWNRQDASQIVLEMEADGTPQLTTTTVAGLTQRFQLRGTAGFVTPPRDGVTDAIVSIQAAHDALLAAGGGPLYIAALPNSSPFFYQWKSTLFWDPRVSLIFAGKGISDFSVANNFPLANYKTRNIATGVVSVGPIGNACLIYAIPYAPFDASGQIVTPSTYGVIPYIEGLGVPVGNKANQTQTVMGVYAPPGKTDPFWPYVAGAFSQNQVTNPGGPVNLNANAQAYYAFHAERVDFDSLSGTGFFAGGDRQRAHLGIECRCTNAGTVDSNGNVVLLARPYDIQGNDGWVEGGGWGGCTGAPQGSGESGLMGTLNNYFSPKGNDSASICVRAEATNGAMQVGNVMNGLARMEIAANNPLRARGGGHMGNNFLWGGTMQSTGANAGRPTGVTTEDGDTFSQYSGYEQCVDLNVYSVGTDGTMPKYHVSATSGAGVMCWESASSDPNVLSYRGAQPWFTDNTLGSIAGGWYDGFTQILHIGVSYKGGYAGANLAATQLVRFETPVAMYGGLAGNPTGVTPGTGFQAEPGFASGSIAASTAATDVVTFAQSGPFEGDIYGMCQITAGSTPTSVQTMALWQLSLSTAANTLDTSNAAKYAGCTALMTTGLSQQAIASLRVGPIHLTLTSTQNVTLHLVHQGAFGGNAGLVASGVISSRRW